MYDGSVLERLTIIHLAKGAGFTVAEIKRLLRGFERRTPPGERRRSLAESKLGELDERIAQAERMKNVLSTLVACECRTFSDCSQAIARGGAPAG